MLDPKDEIEALQLQLNQKAAAFMAPKIEEADRLLGEAFTADWLERYTAFINSLPTGDLKAQLVNMLSVIGHMPAFLSNQRSTIAPFLPKEPPPAAPAGDGGAA